MEFKWNNKKIWNLYLFVFIFIIIIIMMLLMIMIKWCVSINIDYLLFLLKRLKLYTRKIYAQTILMNKYIWIILILENKFLTYCVLWEKILFSKDFMIFYAGNQR